MFTVLDGRVVEDGALVASVKIAPHLVAEAVLARAEAAAGRAGGRGVVSVAPFRPWRVAAIVKESIRGIARDRFETSVRAKVEGLGSTLVAIDYVEDAIGPVAAVLGSRVRGRGPDRVDLVLTAGSSSTDPEDPFFLAIAALGGRIVRHGVPAHPGSMLWLGRVGPGAGHRPAVVRRLLEGDRGGPPPASAPRRRARLHPDHRPSRPRRDPHARPAFPLPRLRTRARRARGLGPVAADEPASIGAMTQVLGSTDAIQEAFRERGYIADRSIATAVFLGLRLERPLLLEGEAGVGKTELAKVLASSLGTRLIRLQCYEGLDVNTAVYEWNYPRQMLEIRLLEARGQADHATAHDIFGAEFLIKRPLLQALEGGADGEPPVLLIDEIDRADEEFEAYLLEILSDFQVTVPEIGTIKAERPPRVILTSNRTREVHDALKRRCLYHWIDYPSAAKEFEIVQARVPGAPEMLARAVVGFVHRLREADLTKVPGIAETLDWAAALMALGAAELTPELVDETLGVVLKYEEDIRQVRGETVKAYLAEAAAGR